jgi:hypothetical protein
MSDLATLDTVNPGTRSVYHPDFPAASDNATGRTFLQTLSDAQAELQAQNQTARFPPNTHFPKTKTNEAPDTDVTASVQPLSNLGAPSTTPGSPPSGGNTGASGTWFGRAAETLWSAVPTRQQTLGIGEFAAGGVAATAGAVTTAAGLATTPEGIGVPIAAGGVTTMAVGSGLAAKGWSDMFPTPQAGQRGGALAGGAPGQAGPGLPPIIAPVTADAPSSAAARSSSTTAETTDKNACPEPTPNGETLASVRPDPAAYQQYVTGNPPGVGVTVNGVNFDGCRDPGGVLLEAKANYGQFLNPDGSWKEFFDGSGTNKLRDQAISQVRAAQGQPIEWHVMQANAATAIQTLLRRDMRTNAITVVHDPMPNGDGGAP